MNEQSEILIYQTEDGETKIQTLLKDETVWLSQAQMAELFDKATPTINEHIKNIYEEGELSEESTIRNFRIVQTEGKREVSRDVNFYNLDVIISVGYRVKSRRGTQFRQWATRRLKEYIVKGFVLDDERLERGSDYDYFNELVERVRAIRVSERRFYQKITDIYATSIDYNPDHPMTQEFFATVQNKFHFAIHGHTAAEMIIERSDANHPLMGLTSFKGEKIRQSDITIAKNYLAEDELKSMNRIVDQYLSFAEEQAAQRKPMHMKDWITKLHGFLELNDRSILHNAGTVTKAQAEKKAIAEYKKYLKIQDQKTVSDFDKTVKRKIGKAKKKKD
ncbi:MAG: hydroxyacid dehydrogenase [Alphaproteobacteria bacterium CG_4_9_14_3_um_filter_47_13]|nr:MAG: hydroxyacid dehydrogenase [Alphaproteobacteria bacterium CG_4_9_14_3_um_filter_47_13]